jgi:HPt (histidine-containing phosphotransfer) domain-containing protein
VRSRRDETTGGAEPPGDEAVAAPEGAGTRDPQIADALAAVSGGDPQFLAELIETFLEDAPQLLRRLRDATDAGDAGTVRLLAHGLKSNGAEFGALVFAERCKDLETLARSGQLAGAPTLVSQIEGAFQHVVAELRAALAQVRQHAEAGAE